MKKLNNKGFTLIELLAVIVILAVVMGIAINSVLSSMNSARGGAIVDTSQVIARAFNEKYAESLVNGAATDVFGDVLGSTASAKKGYDFTATKIYTLDPKLADTFGISSNTYTLSTKAELTSSATNVTSSFVVYNETTGKFVVCMAAQKTGPNYVTGYAVKTATKLSANTITPSADTTYNGITIAAGVMMACSDGTKTWK